MDIMKKADSNNDGKLDFMEFKKAVRMIKINNQAKK